MVRRWAIWLILLSSLAWAGQPEKPVKEKVQKFSGTAPIGAYLSSESTPSVGKTWLGIEATRDLLLPGTEVELVGEISWNSGVTWPPDCLPAPATVCHDHTQVMPLNTEYFMLKTRGDPVNKEPLSGEYRPGRATDSQTRFRGRLIVRGAESTGTIYLTWR
jgi:hypothetical protein